MTPCLHALGLACAFACAPAPAGTLPASPLPRTAPCTTPGANRAIEPWAGEDDARHFTLSFAATSMAYAGARVLLPAEPSRALAGSLAFALGLAKELRDARGPSGFSAQDLAWDAAGVALGVLFVHQIR